MGKLIRFTRTTVVEFEPNPEHYEEGITIEEMAEIEANADDREILFDDCESDTVTWEIIEED